MEIKYKTQLTDEILREEYPVLPFDDKFIYFGFFKATREEFSTVERLEELRERMIVVFEMEIKWK